MKAIRIWKRFLALGVEQWRLDSSAIGEKVENPAYLVNVFTNDGIRRARAIQLLQDLQECLQEEGISLQDFLQLQEG